jgi:hypothetical protein
MRRHTTARRSVITDPNGSSAARLSERVRGSTVIAASEGMSTTASILSTAIVERSRLVEREPKLDGGSTARIFTETRCATAAVTWSAIGDSAILLG